MQFTERCQEGGRWSEMIRRDRARVNPCVSLVLSAMLRCLRSRKGLCSQSLRVCIFPSSLKRQHWICAGGVGERCLGVVYFLACIVLEIPGGWKGDGVLCPALRRRSGPVDVVIAVFLSAYASSHSWRAAALFLPLSDRSRRFVVAGVAVPDLRLRYRRRAVAVPCRGFFAIRLNPSQLSGEQNGDGVHCVPYC